MHDLINAYTPFSTANNSATILTLLWVPALAAAATAKCWFYRHRDKFPREMVVLAMGLFSSIGVLALIGAWESFVRFSIADWALLTGVQLAATLAFGFAARRSTKGNVADNAGELVAAWNRKAKVVAIVLPLFALLPLVGGTRHFLQYLHAAPAIATVVSEAPGPGGQLGFINAEWAAPDGKKIPVVLAFEPLQAFRPVVAKGGAIRFRLDAPQATAGNVYTMDIGLISMLLSYLSDLIFALPALACGFLLLRGKRSAGPAKPPVQ